MLASVTVPVRVMIREADGYEAGSPQEVDHLAGLARRFAALGVNGLVCGFTRAGRIDVESMNAIAQACGPARLTFHRAFDDFTDPQATLRQLQQWSCIDRVLTAGGLGDWQCKAARMREWERATPSIGILAGGGIDLAALRALAAAGLREAHVGRAAREPATVEGAVSRTKVAALATASS